MTSPDDRVLPPLTDLPSPPRLPQENPSLVPPGEILAESRRAITRRLLRICWMPALVLIVLWYLLGLTYVSGASPTFLALSLLVGLFEPMYIRVGLGSLGFTTSGLLTAALLLPGGATALSIALLPLATRWIGDINPRHHLSEASFQRQVATRVTAVLMAPVLLVVALLLILVAQPFGQVPFLHWSSISAGPLTAACAGLLWIMLAWLLIRLWVSAPRVLGVTPVTMLETTARMDRDHDKRRRAAAQVLAQDRRHLPPAPGTPEAAGALTPRGLLTSALLSLRAWLVWVVPTALVLGLMVFGIADVVAVLSGVGQQDLQAVQSAPLNLPTVLGAVLTVAVTVAAAAFAPALAAAMSASQRGQVHDQRTYRAWEHRARVNPWEARVVGLSGWITAAIAGAAIVAHCLLLVLLSASRPLTWSCIVLALLVLVPLAGLGTAMALRSGLRDVHYGPAHLFMRRRTEHALVAPDLGTRADRARDPAVRAHLRQRLQADGNEHSLEIFDLDNAELDAAGERLWIDGSQPGARSTQVRQADIAAGNLPDFGGEGSPFTALPQNDEDHDIPDSVTGLQER